MERVRSLPVAIALAATLHSPIHIDGNARNNPVLLASIGASSTHSDYDTSRPFRFVLRKSEQIFGIGGRGSIGKDQERAIIRSYIENGNLPPHIVKVPIYKPIPFPAPRKPSTPPCNGRSRISKTISHCEI